MTYESERGKEVPVLAPAVVAPLLRPLSPRPVNTVVDALRQNDVDVVRAEHSATIRQLDEAPCVLCTQADDAHCAATKPRQLI